MIGAELAPILVLGEFDAAERATRQYLERAPESALRETMLTIHWQKMAIVDWSAVDSWIEDPNVAAIGIDLSGHFEASTPDDIIHTEISCYHRDVFPFEKLDLENLRSAAGEPWRGEFDDCGVGRSVGGLGPAYFSLQEFARQPKSDWSKDLRQLHDCVEELAQFWCFVEFNIAVKQSLAQRRFARAVPILVGVHDFGVFPTVPHFTQST